MFDNENFIFILTIIAVFALLMFLYKFFQKEEEKELGCILGIFKMLSLIVIVIIVCVTLIIIFKG